MLHRIILHVIVVLYLVSPAGAQVLTGLDVIQQDGFAALQGRKIGIITNQTGVDRNGRHIVDILTHSPGVTVVKLFSPEHGLYGVKDEHVGDMVDEKSGLPVISLYGKTRTPTKETLAGIDTLVFDIQDIGARYYTYIATMGNSMQAAGANGVRFVVLDRPNPVTGLLVDGPNPDKEHIGKFTCYGSFPVAHGMTVGELAKMFNEEYGHKCDLTVVPMQGWKRSMWWDQTGVKWVNPSPNMRSPTEALLYLAVGLMEATNVSVGRGTDIPFECFGAPWIKSDELAKALNDQRLPGLKFEPFDFTPTNTPHKIHLDQKCGGVRITVTDRNAVKPVLSGLTMAWTLKHLYGEQFKFDAMKNLMLNIGVRDALRDMKDPKQVEKLWEKDVAEFRKVREKYLSYQ